MKIWSLQSAAGFVCGFPLVPAATKNYGETILDVAGDGLVWGWTPPGDLRLAKRYGLRAIADVELHQWSGGQAEILQAKALADLAGGVTSHGFVPSALREILAEFVARDRIGYPQVYDSDRSTPVDASFIAKCVESWRASGFDRIVPLLGASAGPARLAAWAAYCRDHDLEFHFWDKSDAERLGCDALAALVAGGEIPETGETGKDESPEGAASSSRFWLALGVGAVMAAGAGAAIGYFTHRPAAGAAAPEAIAEMNLAELRSLYRSATGRVAPPGWDRARLIREVLP